MQSLNDAVFSPASLGSWVVLVRKTPEDFRVVGLYHWEIGRCTEISIIFSQNPNFNKPPNVNREESILINVIDIFARLLKLIRIQSAIRWLEGYTIWRRGILGWALDHPCIHAAGTGLVSTKVCGIPNFVPPHVLTRIAFNFDLIWSGKLLFKRRLWEFTWILGKEFPSWHCFYCVQRHTSVNTIGVPHYLVQSPIISRFLLELQRDGEGGEHERDLEGKPAQGGEVDAVQSKFSCFAYGNLSAKSDEGFKKKHIL